jgi:hypothetical protein
MARMAAVVVLALGALAGVLVVSSGSGGATGSRALSADRHPSIAPLPPPFQMSAAKAARFRAMDRLRQRAASIPATPPSGGSTQAGLIAGILGLHDGGPFSSAQFVGTNLWNGPVGGHWLVVQAGGVPVSAPAAMPARPADLRAAVFVYSRSLRPDSSGPERVVGVVRAPGDPSGELRAVRFGAGVVRLSLSGSARVYRFSVRSLRFVS